MEYGTIQSQPWSPAKQITGSPWSFCRASDVAFAMVLLMTVTVLDERADQDAAPQTLCGWGCLGSWGPPSWWSLTMMCFGNQ